MAAFDGYRPQIMYGDEDNPTPELPLPEHVPGQRYGDYDPRGSSVLPNDPTAPGESGNAGYGGSLAARNAYHIIKNKGTDHSRVVWDNGDEEDVQDKQLNAYLKYQTTTGGRGGVNGKYGPDDTTAAGKGGGGGGSGSGASAAHAQDQLALEYQKMLASEHGPKDWASYFFHSRGYETPRGAEPVPMSAAIPPWAQPASGASAWGSFGRPADASQPAVPPNGGLPQPDTLTPGPTGQAQGYAQVTMPQWAQTKISGQPSTPGANPQAMAFNDTGLLPAWAQSGARG